MSLTVAVALASVGTLALLRQRSAAWAVGAIDASTLWAIAWLVVQASGTGNAMAGGDAEDWTAAVLRKLGAKRWHALHDVPLEASWDADHIVVGPTGVFVLETKWTATRQSERRGYLRGRLEYGADQAWRGARRVRSVLRGAGVIVDVEPVVVLWGPRDAWGDDHPVGVAIVHGDDLAEWLTHRHQNELTEDEIMRASEALDGFAAMRIGHDTETHPVSRFVEVGIAGIWKDVPELIIAALAGMFVLALLMARLRWPFVLAPMVAVPVAGWLVQRVPRLRMVGLGWLIGTGGITVGLLGYLAFLLARNGLG